MVGDGQPATSRNPGPGGATDEVRDRRNTQVDRRVRPIPSYQRGRVRRSVTRTVGVYGTWWPSRRILVDSSIVRRRVRRSTDQRSARSLVAFVSRCHRLAILQTASGLTTTAAEQLRPHRQRSPSPWVTVGAAEVKLVVLLDELGRVAGSSSRSVRLDVKQTWMPLQLLHTTVQRCERGCCSTGITYRCA